MSLVPPDRLARGLYWSRAWSLISGCSHAGTPGCDNCWSAAEAHTHGGQANAKIRARYAGLTTTAGRWTGEVREMEESLDLPLRTRKPQVWALWTDLFHSKVSEAFRIRAFDVIRTCAGREDGHVFLVLTKRPLTMRDFCQRLRWWSGDFQPGNGAGWIGTENPHPKSTPLVAGLKNLWLGVTVENQEQAHRRIPELLATPAAHRWISAEPLLGPVDLRLSRPATMEDQRGSDCDGPVERVTRAIDLVVAGGESGKGARPCHPNWARGLRDQCAAAGVPFMWKQWGRWVPYNENAPLSLHFDGHCFEDGQEMNACPLQKKAIGRLLDGREHLALPWAQEPEEDVPW